MFGTDLSEAAIAKARGGIYPSSISLDVPPERLRRYFMKTETSYQIAKTIRDLCVFSRQIVTQDPPFSHIDLISCRNVLIYMDAQLQKKLMPIFHYALKPTGFLFLGSAETVSGFSDLFAPLDKKNRIYAKKVLNYGPKLDFTTRTFPAEGIEPQKGNALRRELGSFQELQRMADQTMLNRFAPSGVLTNSNLEVLQFRGQTGTFLEHAPGEASLNLLKMVRPSLVVELRAAIFAALKKHTIVRREGLRVQHQGQNLAANIEVIPLKVPASDELFFLIVFEGVRLPSEELPDGEKSQTSRGRDRQMERLRKELASTKESLQAIIEEQEATNEEVKSANEEIQSSNEELQSTNEELETAKEELQSANEELTTVNEELQNRNLELTEVNNDLSNLHSSINIPILMLGSDLTLRRYTPPAEKFFNVIPADIGRPISDIKPKILVQELESKIAEVMDSLNVLEKEVQDTEGNWHSLRIRPYRTRENKIEGVVICLLDIGQLKVKAEELNQSTIYTEMILSTLQEPFLILDTAFRIKSINAAFCRLFQIAKEEAENEVIFTLGKGGWNIPQLKKFFQEVLASQERLHHRKLQHDFPKLGPRTLILNARRAEGRTAPLILLAIENVTRRA
jgi:two-component system CheB/CheR fusion protein